MSNHECMFSHQVNTRIYFFQLPSDNVRFVFYFHAEQYLCPLRSACEAGLLDFCFVAGYGQPYFRLFRTETSGLARDLVGSHGGSRGKLRDISQTDSTVAPSKTSDFL